MNIDFLEDEIKTFYPYRKNRCSHSFIINDVSFIEVKQYIESQGFCMDNHISWENEYGLCFTYSDHTLYIGNKMIGKSW